MPADIADIAQDITDNFVDIALKKMKIVHKPFSGFCLNCAEPLVQRRFCDSECRTQYEQKLRKQKIEQPDLS